MFGNNKQSKQEKQHEVQLISKANQMPVNGLQNSPQGNQSSKVLVANPNEITDE